MSRRTKRRTDTPKSQAQVGGAKPKTTNTGAVTTELKKASAPASTASAVVKVPASIKPAAAPAVVSSVVPVATAATKSTPPTPPLPVQAQAATAAPQGQGIDLLPVVPPVPIQKPLNPTPQASAAKAPSIAAQPVATPPIAKVPASLAPVATAESKKVATPAPKSKKALIWGFAGILALVCGLGAAGGAYANWTNGEQIAPNVFIAGENISGLTTKGATWRLRHRFDTLPLQLAVGDIKYDLKLADIGGHFSVEPTVAKAFQVGREGSFASNFLHVYGNKASSKRFMLPLQWDKEALVAKLRELDKKYRVEPVDARLKMGSNGLEVVPGTTGRAINIGESARLIQLKYYAGLKNLELPTREIAPQVTAEALAGRDVQLAHYTTRFNPGLVGRTINIHVAASAIEGRVLMPGERFSFNSCTGERTWDKGYRMAHIFERKPGAAEAEVVDGLAGGTCQVSSTLFNAVRAVNANAERGRLKIVERNTHSLPVTYVPRGLDATVAWPYKDFKFRNAFDYPVYLRTAVGRRNLTVSVWARIPNNQTGVVSEPETSEDETTDATL